MRHDARGQKKLIIFHLMKTIFLLTALIFSAATAVAHVRVRPAESPLGATESYTLRVPSERGLTTKSIILNVPEGVTIFSVGVIKGVSEISFEEKESGNGRRAITWSIEIKPGESAELSFVAQNPNEGAAIIWRVQQNYTDGTASSWVGPKGDKAPAPVTNLIPSKEKK